MKFGLNLYSLRKSIADENGFLSTAERLKVLGYDFLQFSGAPFDAEEIKRVSDNSKMPVCLTHVPINRILDDTEKLIEEHALFSCKKIGLGMLDLDDDENTVKRHIARLNEAGKVMQDRGYALCYHNHNYEFFKNSDGVTWFDYILKNAPFVHFTIDVYWVQYGGAPIDEVLKKAQGRVDCVHLKDYKTELKNGVFVPVFAPVGDGNINFDRVIRAAKDAGTEYFIVEQDDACFYPDPFSEVGKSIKYLKENFCYE